MDTFRTKIRWSLSYSMRILLELLKDLWKYYFTPYPFLLIVGSLRRINRRLRIIWLSKPKGRPPIHENVVDLIIEMKRCNQGWGAQRISDELQQMGIKVSRKTVLKILKVNGFVPSWTSIIAKINSWTPLLSNTVVKSIAQYRRNESKTERHEGDANRVQGGTNPFILRILRTGLLETLIPISWSSLDIL